MIRRFIIHLCVLLITTSFWVSPGFALSGKGIVQLKKAGVSDQTIEIIAQEKVIETAAFSVSEIVEMKRAGLGEPTLQMLIKESSFLRKSDPLVYGENTRTIRFTTVQDVIELKKSGLSDEVIQAIIAVTGERYYSQQEEAHDLLKGMGVVVDTRRGRGDRGKISEFENQSSEPRPPQPKP
ncbi:hypothetical protein JY97_11700 [Alkalispirochaeta odontotermitis]|nr:hypothetical protein JY97_11700 [Alkalispirochaeta odontotermitis]CAB1068098.1 hypothetical protein D1AOALGA4SA_227 [Olavius algarvensis Delta 1 endosymbiont]